MNILSKSFLFVLFLLCCNNFAFSKPGFFDEYLWDTGKTAGAHLATTIADDTKGRGNSGSSGLFGGSGEAAIVAGDGGKGLVGGSGGSGIVAGDGGKGLIGGSGGSGIFPGRGGHGYIRNGEDGKSACTIS